MVLTTLGSEPAGCAGVHQPRLVEILGSLRSLVMMVAQNLADRDLARHVLHTQVGPGDRVGHHRSAGGRAVSHC